MRNQEDMLKRAGLKYFGCYLMDGAMPGPHTLERDATEKELSDRAYQRLEENLKGVDEKQSEQIEDAAAFIDFEGHRAGFYSGLKVGARLVLNLLDRGEIIF